MAAKRPVTPDKPTVEVVRLDDVHADPANVREHGDANKSAIRASLARFGSGRSIVLDGRNVVRAGNGTVDAAVEEGFTEILVIEPKAGQLVAVRRPDWTDTEATGYAIADNRTTDLSTFENLKLAQTLEAIRSDPTMSLEACGYDDDQLSKLLESLAREAGGDETAGASDPAKRYEVLVECRDETHQRAVYERLAGNGETCRILTL